MQCMYCIKVEENLKYNDRTYNMKHTTGIDTTNTLRPNSESTHLKLRSGTTKRAIYQTTEMTPRSRSYRSPWGLQITWTPPSGKKSTCKVSISMATTGAG
jgi:hypothetical protein